VPYGPIQLREAVNDPLVRGLRILQLALMAGALLFAGSVFLMMTLRGDETPGVPQGSLMRMLTAANLAWMVVAHAAGAWLFRRRMEAAPPDDASGAVGALREAWIVRLALAEGSALFGSAACMMAVLGGTLPAQPVWWVNLVPVAVFTAFGAVTLPDRDRLLAVLSERPRP